MASNRVLISTVFQGLERSMLVIDFVEDDGIGSGVAIAVLKRTLQVYTGIINRGEMPSRI